MKRVAISGADGFTGTYLTKLLAREGYEVHGLVRSAPYTNGSAIRYWPCDLLDETSVLTALTEIQPHKIVHLGAISFIGHGNIDEMYRTNIFGTRNILEGAIRISCLETILVASSANVYGNSYSGILSEEMPLSPANDYAVSKLAMEYLCKSFQGKLPIITARPFNYTGVGQSQKFLIPKIVDHIKRRADAIELGNLDVERDFSDVRSVVAAYAALLKKPSAIGETYNICSGVVYSLRNILYLAEELSGQSLKIRINPEFVRIKEVKTLGGSRKRLDSLIPNLPNPPFRETLEWMINA